MERLFTIGFALGFLSHIDSVSNTKKEAEYLPPEIALLHTVRVLIADRLLPSRACFHLTP
ncbi:MAG: hypothetical protein ACK5MK_06900 [Dysgonomonas sp.]